MTKKVKETKTVVESKVNLDGMTTMSEKIRTLSAAGHTRGEISKILNIRYQWVRNVLVTPLKKVK